MTVKQDAGNLLLFFYDEIVTKHKHVVDNQDAEKALKWDNARINIAFHYLKDNGCLGTFQIGQKDKPIFRVTGLSPKGIDIVEDEPKFKDRFGIGINLGVFNINWSTTEE